MISHLILNEIIRAVYNLKRHSMVLFHALILFGLCSVIGCGGNWDIQGPSDLADKFKEVFGVPVRNDLHEMRCRVVNVGDTSSCWFSFKCPQKAFDEITQRFDKVDGKALGLDSQTSKYPFDVYAPNVNAPKWWPEVRKLPVTLFFYRINNTDTSGGYLYLFYDFQAGCAYAFSTKWR